MWQGRIVSESTLSSRIKAARQVVGDSGREQQVIRTVHGRGFRFVAPVQTPEAATDEPQAGPRAVSGRALGDDERPSIAVLPFENLSGSPDEEYFADGITDEITLLLARNRWLQVISRHSSFALKERALDAREMGKTLGARYLIAGSVHRAAPRVRVGAQLVQAADGTQLWSERYDRELTDIFDLQDEIAQTIAGTLEPELAGAEEARLAIGYPPVGEVAVFRHLVGPHDRHVDHPTPDHSKGVSVVDDGHPGPAGDELAASIDQVFILFSFLGQGAVAYDAVLRMGDDFPVGVNVV